MKKHYTKLTIVIALLIFAAFMLTGAFFTYINASRIKDEYAQWTQILIDDKHTYAEGQASIDSIIFYTYRDEWMFMSELYPADEVDKKSIGFYGSILEYDENNDKKEMEVGNFIWVMTYDPVVDKTEYRIMPVEKDFICNNRVYDVVGHGNKIEAKVDDNFIFDGTISFEDYTYPDFGGEKVEREFSIGSNEFVSDDALPYSEWIKDKEKECTSEYCSMADTKAKEKLNNEAKQLNEKLSKEEGPIMSNAQGNLLTSYCRYVSGYNTDAGHAYVTSVFVYHPLMIAIKHHIFFYTAVLIMLAVIEIFVVIMMRKLYSNRMSYELMRQDLTRSIAHDLKTPLAITKAYTENWEYIDEEDRPKYAQMLNDEVDHMASMINNMLNMSKMDQGEKELHLEEVDLYKIASDIYEHMQPMIEDRGLKASLVTDKEDGEYIVSADPNMIKTVINNFITNAVKYSSTKMEIKLLGTDKKVMFMVTNDGVGIQKKDIKKIWEPFYKADKSRTDRISSHGMGLAICRSILKLHKAKYGCKSNYADTSFWFEMRKVK